MFYKFWQNNSGGVFDVDDRVAHYVIIEANDVEQANDIAESIGIYFNGVTSGYDCGCCGDRWHRVDGHDQEETFTDDHYQNIANEDFFAAVNEPVVRIFYMNGTQKTFYKKGDKS